MQQQYLANFFEAALIQLKNEINSYTHKEHVWEIRGDIKNSGGTLTLHLIGNLNHFIGAVLGNSGYARDRVAEFADRNIPTSKLMKEIDETSYLIKNTIINLSDEQLYGDYPLVDGKQWKKTDDRLLQLLTHLNYHLGQVNYHRRLFDQPVSLPDEVLQLEKR